MKRQVLASFPGIPWAPGFVWLWLWAFVMMVLIGVSLLLPATTLAQSSADKVRQMAGVWVGDFDGMLERYRIRVLVVQSKTFFFLDGLQQRWVTHDVFKAFEKFVNAKLGKRAVKVQVVFVPVSRDQLIPGLLEGRGDIAAANLTITPVRKKLVNFSDPLIKNVREIVVTGPSAAAIATLDDLSGKTIHVRRSSSYYESLARLNISFQKAGKPQVKLVPADENLEDEDLLEMVNAGLLPMVVIDAHKATFWAQIFEDITLHPDVAVNTGGEIAWAFRTGSPKLRKVLNAFVKKTKKGTLLGNILLKRYLKSTKYVKNALAEEEMAKFNRTVGLFRKYAGEYDFDWLVVAALGYQESRLDQSMRSGAGAIGVMQLLPSTAADPNVGVENIEKIEPNIHAGVKYLHFLKNRYFSDASIDKFNQWLFTFASYNAGPARVVRLRREAAVSGLDPNVWFRNVELIAAKRIGRETVQYVSNIYKYYIAYSLVLERLEMRDAARAQSR